MVKKLEKSTIKTLTITPQSKIILLGILILTSILCINLVSAETWNVSTASYDGDNITVTSESITPIDVSFKSDGTIMYVLGNDEKKVIQYALSSAWNVSTAIYGGDNTSVASEASNSPYGLFFKSDGIKMYVVDNGNDAVYQYNLSIAWNVSTASYDSKSKDVFSEDGTPVGIFFKSDGTKMYMSGNTNDDIYQYNLSAAWDVSTASYYGDTISVNSQGDFPTDLDFKSDGTIMYVTSYNDDRVYQYALSSAWNVSTAIYGGDNKSVLSEDGNPFGLYFKSDGTIMYMSGSASDSIYQYSLGQVEAKVEITLISPTDNKALSTTETNFIVNYAATNYNFTNATYYIYDSTGIFNNSVIVTITGESNSTTEEIGGFVLENYEWNVWTCYKNSTFSDCSFADSNFSFEYVGFSITKEDYANVTIEGDTELFLINVSMESEYRISTADLIYNGTAYGGNIFDAGGGDYEITRYLTIPDFNVTANQTFYWNFLFENGFETNTTTHNQTVLVLAVDDCSTYTTVLLNYTLRDEESQDVLNVTLYNSTVEIDLKLYPLGSTTPILNFSQNYSENSNPKVCISQNLTNTSEYSIDVQTRYSADSYASEFHNLQNFSITNSTVPQNINLYDLLDADAQKFLVTYKDENFLPVEDALIDIQRKYIADGVFKSVEIPKTDSSGQTTGHFDLYGVVYTIIVSKQGTVLSTFDNIAVVCQDLIIEDCRINLNALATAIPFTEWEKQGGITYHMVFNPVARTITTIFSTTDGSSKTIAINTTKYDRFGNESICSDTLTSSSGTLTCTIPNSFGNITMETKLYSDGELITTRIFSISPDLREYFGANVTIMLLIMIITIPLMLVTSTIGVIIGIFMGFIMAALLLLYTSSSFLGVTSSLIWIILAGGIIIWKITRRGG